MRNTRSKKHFARREDIIAGVMPIFRKYGLDGTTLSIISEEIGLKRSSLYHHFPNGKEEMAAACLTYVEAEFSARVFDVLKSDRTPESRISVVTKELQSYYNDGQLGCLLAAFAMENARVQFEPQVKRILQSWIGSMAKLFRDQGQSERTAREAAEEVICDIQGALIVSAGLGTNRPFKRALKQMAKYTRE